MKNSSLIVTISKIRSSAIMLTPTIQGLCIFALAVWGCSSKTPQTDKDDSIVRDSESGEDTQILDTDGDRNDNHASNLKALLALLPAKTRGVLAVDFSSLFQQDAAPSVARMLNGEPLEPSVARLFRMIAANSLQLDIEQTLTSTVLAQTTQPKDGEILLSRIKFDTLQDIPDIAPLQESSSYKNYKIYLAGASGRSVALLPGRVLVVAEEEILHSIIDLQGETPAENSSSALAPYLADLHSGHPLTIVYGLPALYREMDAGFTLKSANAFSVWLDLAADSFSGEARFYTEKAEKFAKTYNQSTQKWKQPPLEAIPAENEKTSAVRIPIERSSLEKNPDETIVSRHAVKMLFDLMEAKDNISKIASRETLPWKNFTVSADPPSLFINWEIPESRVQAFSEAVLPKGFEMMKLKILETDTPAYYLSLNIYKALGLVSGVRFEWSVFVKDPLYNKPRFMVIEAMAEGVTMDPVNLLTSGEPVTYDYQEGHLVSTALKETEQGEVPYFSSLIKWPQQEPFTARSSREFVAANDHIFWGGGVADRGMYSGTVYNRDVTIIPPPDYQIEDNTPWAQYIEKEPKSVYVYQNGLDIVVAMWSNLDQPYLDLTEAQRDNLEQIRTMTTTTFMETDVANAFNGTDHAILNVEVDNTLPSAYFNYMIDEDKLAELEAALSLPQDAHFKKIKILESENEPAYYLTLAVFTNNGAVEGTRAEWWVYADNGDGKAHVVIVDLLTQDVGLEPVKLATLPSVVERVVEGQKLQITLASSHVNFQTTIEMDGAKEDLPTLNWIESRENVCYLNGICDKLYVDGGSVSAPVQSFEPQKLDLRSAIPWADFIGTSPASVFLRTERQFFARKPWYNVQAR